MWLTLIMISWYRVSKEFEINEIPCEELITNKKIGDCVYKATCKSKGLVAIKKVSYYHWDDHDNHDDYNRKIIEEVFKIK
jgi:hypothetical protein